jgi:hypothetical protein
MEETEGPARQHPETAEQVAERLREAQLDALRRLVALGLGRVEPTRPPQKPQETQPTESEEVTGLLAGMALHGAMRLLEDLGVAASDSRRAAQELLDSLAVADSRATEPFQARVPPDREVTMAELSAAKHDRFQDYIHDVPASRSLSARKF